MQTFLDSLPLAREKMLDSAFTAAPAPERSPEQRSAGADATPATAAAPARGRGADWGWILVAVKSNGGAAGVDGQTIEQFEADLKCNLYKIWNRMSSGRQVGGLHHRYERRATREARTSTGLPQIQI
jgi:hypothetical protein